jgi:hypothetical protein
MPQKKIVYLSEISHPQGLARRRRCSRIASRFKNMPVAGSLVWTPPSSVRNPGTDKQRNDSSSSFQDRTAFDVTSWRCGDRLGSRGTIKNTTTCGLDVASDRHFHLRPVFTGRLLCVSAMIWTSNRCPAHRTSCAGQVGNLSQVLVGRRSPVEVRS